MKENGTPIHDLKNPKLYTNIYTGPLKCCKKWYKIPSKLMKFLKKIATLINYRGRPENFKKFLKFFRFSSQKTQKYSYFL